MSIFTNCRNCWVIFDLYNHFPLNCPCNRFAVCRKCVRNNGNFLCIPCSSGNPNRYSRYDQFIENSLFAELAADKENSAQKLRKERTTNKEVKADVEDEKTKLQKQVKEYAEMLEEDRETIEKMRKRIDELENVKKLESGDVKCVQCGFIENENRFHICQTCTQAENKIDVLNSEKLSEIDVKSLAICSTCSIRQHFRKHHDVIDFYPILAAKNHSNQINVSKNYRSKLERELGNLEAVYRKWAVFVREGKDEVSTMTDMVRRAKTSVVQGEIGKMIEKKSEEFIGAIKNAAENLNSLGNAFGVEILESKEESLKQAAEKCWTREEFEKLISNSYTE